LVAPVIGGSDGVLASEAASCCLPPLLISCYLCSQASDLAASFQ